MANETTQESKKSCVRGGGKNPHPGRDSRSALRRAAIVACLRAHPTLGAGMQAAGVSWPTVVAMMRCPDFRAAVRAIREEQRARRPHRHRAENKALSKALTGAGLPWDIAQRERRRMRGIADHPSAAETAQGVL